MPLLDIAQDAASQLGLRRPDAIIGSTDLTAQLLLRFANQGGKELARYHDWQKLVTEKTYTTVAQIAQTGALASDFDRFSYNPEVWNRTTNQRYTGPTPQRIWQQLQNGITGGVSGWWRLRGGDLLIYPAPTAGQTLAFEYVSKNWCASSGGTGQSAFADDTDTLNVPEDLMVLEIVWRFRQSRGFAQYAEDLSTCEREKEKAAARDRGTGRIRPDGTDSMNWPPTPFWDGTISDA